MSALRASGPKSCICTECRRQICLSPYEIVFFQQDVALRTAVEQMLLGAVMYVVHSLFLLVADLSRPVFRQRQVSHTVSVSRCSTPNTLVLIGFGEQRRVSGVRAMHFTHVFEGWLGAELR
jgi:hypothetical protein